MESSKLTLNGDLPGPEVWLAVPVYNHAESLAPLLEELRYFPVGIVVVDDGSDEPISGILGDKLRDVSLLSHKKRLGKGAAILSAVVYARECGAKFLITMDADGQHSPSDIPLFLAKIAELKQGKSPILIGWRDMAGAGAPFLSRLGLFFSNFMLFLETGVGVCDSQSGFRAYPMGVFEKSVPSSRGYEFETEILVLSLLDGRPLVHVPISVSYPKNRISHFRIFSDTARFFVMHLRLAFFSWKTRLANCCGRMDSH